MNRLFLPLSKTPRAVKAAPALFCALLSLALFSCGKNSAVASVRTEELFSLSYGSFEEQLDLAGGLNSAGEVNAAIAMRDGFFYISNGGSQKILELNSYGDLLTLYHNPESNPAPLFDSSGGRQNSAQKGASTRKTVEYPFNAPSALALDSSRYVYVVETLPKERQESADNKILRQVVLRFDSSSFAGYIGQQGIGGTPFPFIRNIYACQDDSLAVVCVASDAFEIFRYGQDGLPLSKTVIKYSAAPEYGEAKPGVTRYSEIENVIPDPAGGRFFVKADYYETSIDASSKIQNGVDAPVSVVFPFDFVREQFGEGIEIPPYEDVVSDGFSKQVFKLPYDMLGATKNGWLFFSMALEDGCMLQMLDVNSGRSVKRLLKFNAANVVYSAFSVGASGIVSALLAERGRVKVVWWRTDSLADQ